MIVQLSKHGSSRFRVSRTTANIEPLASLIRLSIITSLTAQVEEVYSKEVRWAEGFVKGRILGRYHLTWAK
jgi:hypothetical protein